MDEKPPSSIRLGMLLTTAQLLASEQRGHELCLCEAGTPIRGPSSVIGAARPTQLAPKIFLSTHPLSELLKFLELCDQRFETLSKHCRRPLRSNAGIHDTPPDQRPKEKSLSIDREKPSNSSTIA
jgi:hypothetical protein